MESQTTLNTLYLDANMGASGDMIQGTLYELLDKKQQAEYLTLMNAIDATHLSVTAVSSSKCDIKGTHMIVKINNHEEPLSYSHESDHASNDDHHHDHHHDHHRSYLDLMQALEGLNLPLEVVEHARSIYTILGEAEASVHGSTLNEIHFHEIGSQDAFMDIVGCCLLFYLLHPTSIICSPIHVGSGHVHCAHGILPVPAPATALILLGIPSYSGDIDGELCTPTGAAILRHYVTAYGSMPVMIANRIGYGLGTKDFPIANCLRSILGYQVINQEESVVSLQCNVDDMTGEALGLAMEQLFHNGALDVTFTPIYMKKNRPGHLITCLAKINQQDQFIRLMLECTTTRGVRYQIISRHTLSSTQAYEETPYGKVLVKTSTDGITTKRKIEYESIKENIDSGMLINTSSWSII